MNKKIIKKYLVKNDDKTDMVSSLKKLPQETLDEVLEEYYTKKVEELSKYIIDSFEEILEMTKNDIFTQMFFIELINNENSNIFSAYDTDIENFNVFIYNQGSYYAYYIPDELKKLIKKKIDI